MDKKVSKKINLCEICKLNPGIRYIDQRYICQYCWTVKRRNKSDS